MTVQPDKFSKEYTLGEEIANAITHGIGTGLAVAALVVLVVQAARHGTSWHVVSYIIFGVSLIALYAASTLYHSISIPQPKLKPFFKRIDHLAIFVLIAGTYTPFLLGSLRGPWGWALFAVIWSLAVAGVVLKLGFFSRFERPAIVLYLLMGWLVIIAIKPVVATLPLRSIIAIGVGGLSYTIGVVFYIWKRLPYNHAIWHLFVIGGSVAHFLAVFFILR